MKFKQISEGKTGSRPSWDEYFMGLAIWASTRSSCQHVRAGSIFVFNKRVIGTGYNGTPPGVKKNCLETGCRKDNEGLNYEKSLNTGRCIGVHAEVNALGHLTGVMGVGATLYTTIFPCHTCAKDLLAYKVKKIIFKSFYSSTELERTYKLFKEAKVKIVQLDMSINRYFDIIVSRPLVDFDVFTREEIIKGKEVLSNT